MGKNIQFEVDSLGYDGIYDDYIILDKSYVNSEYMLITLVGPKDDSINFQDNVEARNYGDWIHERPADDEYYYAAGMAPEYYYQSSSWKQALTRALEEMALLLSSKVEAMNKDETITINDHNIYNYYRISRFEEDYTLRDWQVAARKIEKINSYTKTYNVLIRMPKYK